MSRRIRVLELYQGRLTQELPIRPGDYELYDERLFGLGRYLVTEQHKAVWLNDRGEVIDSAPAEDVPEPQDEAVVAPEVEDEPELPIEAPAEVVEPVNYDRLKFPELEALIDERGIDYPEFGTGADNKVLKRDLIAALTEADQYEESF